MTTTTHPDGQGRPRRPRHPVLHPVAELRSRRAAGTELESLDPEVDHVRMTQLTVGRLFCDPVFVMLLTTVAYWRNTAIPSVARILARKGDGETLSDPHKRLDDTLAFFGFMYRDGCESQAAGATLDRVVAIHERFPAIRADDFRYTLTTLCFEPVRIPEILGVPGLTGAEARALFLAWRNIGRRMGIDMPEEQADFRAWMVDYEAREFAYTPEAADLAQAVGEDCVQRYFPGPAGRLGWGMLRSMADDRLLRAIGQPPPSAAMRRLTALITRAYVGGRRVVPGPDRDNLVAPWTKAYGPCPSPSDVGPGWAADITAASRRHATVGRPGAG
ncbi:MAG: hypothetical protein QOJ69_1098 [Actinomycetota bacterium]|nr:hypothetical protein [Actinomycetota bacterium]